MPMLAETLDGVIGVDTHRDTLTAAAVTAIGGLLDHATASTDAAGYRELLGFATSRCRVGAAGRSRVPAASAPAWRPFSLTMVSRSSRSHADADQPAAMPPRATPWTRSTSPATPSSPSTRPSCAAAATARPSGSC
jgi:hypothetical protein